MGCVPSSSSSAQIEEPSLPASLDALEAQGQAWKDRLIPLGRVAGDKPVRFYAITSSVAAAEVFFAVGKRGRLAEVRNEAAVLIRRAVDRSDVVRPLALVADGDAGVLLTELCDGGLLERLHLRHIRDPRLRHDLTAALKAAMMEHPDPQLSNVVLASVRDDASSLRIKLCDWAPPPNRTAISTIAASGESNTELLRAVNEPGQEWSPRELGDGDDAMPSLDVRASPDLHLSAPTIQSTAFEHPPFDLSDVHFLPPQPNPLAYHGSAETATQTDQPQWGCYEPLWGKLDSELDTWWARHYLWQDPEIFEPAPRPSVSSDQSREETQTDFGPSLFTSHTHGLSLRASEWTVKWVTLSQVFEVVVHLDHGDLVLAISDVIARNKWPLWDLNLVEGRLAYLPGITKPFRGDHPLYAFLHTLDKCRKGATKPVAPAPVQQSSANPLAGAFPPSTADLGARPRGCLNRFQKWHLGIRTEPLELRSLPLEMARRRKQDGDRAANPQATLVAILELIAALPMASHQVAPDVAALQRVRAAAALDVAARVTLELVAWLLAAKHAPALSAVARELVDRGASAITLHPYVLPAFADRCLRRHEGVRSTVRNMCARAVPTAVDGAARAGIADWNGLVDAFARSTFIAPCFAGDADVAFDGVTLASGVVLLVARQADSAEAVGLAAIHEFGHFARIRLLGPLNATPPVAASARCTAATTVPEAGDEIEAAVCGSRRFANLSNVASQRAVCDWDGVSAFPVIDTPPVGNPAGPCGGGGGRSAVLMLAPAPTRRRVTISSTQMDSFAPTPGSSDDGDNGLEAAVATTPAS